MGSPTGNRQIQIIAIACGGFFFNAPCRVYNEKVMAMGIVRRVLYGALAVWAFALAVEQSHLEGHTGTVVAFAMGGLVLLVLAIAGKGGG
jgi:hypothetical protein